MSMPSTEVLDTEALAAEIVKIALPQLVTALRTALDKPAPELEWYTTQQAADATGWSAYTIRQACNQGRIPAEYVRKSSQRLPIWEIHRDGIQWMRSARTLSVSR